MTIIPGGFTLIRCPTVGRVASGEPLLAVRTRRYFPDRIRIRAESRWYAHRGAVQRCGSYPVSFRTPRASRRVAADRLSDVLRPDSCPGLPPADGRRTPGKFRRFRRERPFRGAVPPTPWPT